MQRNKFMKSKSVFHTLILGFTLLLLSAANSYGAVSAGYSEYYIPGDELNMWTVFDTLDDAGANTTMHAVISVTAWSDNTTLYYDHWEHCNGIPVGSPGCVNGYNFDPDNPAATADETVIFTNAGDLNAFESSNIPTTPRGTATYYDGGDRIYVAGGAVTVTRASWIEAVGVGNQSAAWEIYPVKPQLTTYILPFGENLGFADFNRVFVLIQATEDNTTFQVDLNGDGTYDTLNQNRDGDKTDAGVDTDTVTLQRGETFLLDRTSACLNGGILCTSNPGNLNSGILIQGNKTLQVKFVAGNPGQNYCARGFSAFPRGFWTKDYYAPVDQPTGGAADTDYYLHNPNSSAITITWEALSSSGSFSIPAKSTISFRTASGGSVPVNSGVYFTGSDVFWGVGVGDAGSNAYEWGFSLLPSTMLYEEHFLGWAPGSIPIDAAGNPGNQDNDGVFLAVAQDNTRVWVDFNSDGTADLIDADGNGTPESSYVTLDRLQTQFIYNPNTGDLSKAHFWATGPFTMSYGENADTATTSTPSLDLGYVAIPGTDFISLVLTVDKSVSPQVVPTASGSVATFTIKVNSHKYTVDSVAVTDYLPPDWQYVVGTDTTTITKPDLTTVTGASADPTVTGTGPYTLSWSNAQVGGTMAENQEITIIFTARTTAELPVGALSQNRVQAVGERTFAPGETQTFTATDFAYAVSGDFTVAKASSAIDPLYPGDTFTYTVTVTNPASAASNQTGISVYDPLPAGISYVADSSEVTLATTVNVLDQFGAIAYTNNDGSVDWSTEWTEIDNYGTGPAGTGADAAGGFVWITGGQLQFRYQLSTVRDEFGSASYTLNYGSDTWATDWIETGDGLGAGGGNILITGGELSFDAAQVNDTIQRTATVTGATSATFNFTLTDGGIDGGETMIAEYSLDGGAFVAPPLGTYDGGTGGWSGVPQTFTIALAGNNSLTLRFRVAGGSYEGGEQVYIDNVNIAYNVPADASGTQVQRTADLTGATSAALTFTSAWANLEASDTMVVEASSTGNPGSFTPLATATGNAAFAPAGPYDLTSYISANTTIRFRTTGGYNATNETRSIDNVDISMSGVFTLPAGSPPNFVSSSSGYSLTPGQQMTLTYNVTVDDPLAAGIDQITNTAYANSNEIILPISASVTNIIVNPNSQSASVGDRVWFDADGDGVFDIGEPGLSNVEVTLKDQFGLPLLTTTTDVTGHYLFTGLIPGGIGYYVEVTGGLPSGITQSAPSGRTDNRTNSFDLRSSLGNNRDEFGTTSYSNNDGSVNWTTNPWVETDNTGGGATFGEIRITGGELRINSDTATGNSIYRDLSIPEGAVEATLSFDWRTATVEATDSIVFEISSDGATYTTLQTFTGITGTSSGSLSVDISDYLSASTRVRFRTAALYTQADDYFYVDNVNIEYFSALTEYLGADIGYAPAAGTATFGDTVWSDFDGDGIRDLGEPGLTGIAVQLCPDTNGNLFWDALADVPCTSTVTAPGGYYLFTGVAATGSEDYFIVIDTAQTPLTGFAGTTVDPLSVENASAGSVTMNLDFGFRNATETYTIRDRIWYDSNADEQDDGESGIGGVTVDLLDASLNVIATTITDVNGYFSFNGVIGAGADYTVRITDTGNMLSNYYGITDEAIAGEVEIINLSGNLDFTVEPTEPHFGYGLTRSISGTVFNDLNGSGTLTAGESGMAGITVSLYNDVNGNGLLDGGDTLQAALTTDSNGNYLFAGLTNGNYITSISSPPSGYTYTTESPADNDPAAGDQQTAIISGGGNVQDLNFGYQSATPRSVSGQLWKDSDADGNIDAGETGLAGVTIELLDGSTLVATTTTDAGGNYTFSGLTPASYTVQVTDTLDVLAGYDATYEIIVGTSGPFDGMAPADLTSGDLTGANFGFRQGPVITLAVISDFRASVVDGTVVIAWDTIYEKGTIGFYLYRREDASGEYLQVNDTIIPGLVFAPRGGSYRVIDNDAFPGRTYSYQLVEIEAKNTKEKRNIYGPFQVTALEIWGPHSEEMSVSAPFSRMEHSVPEATKDRMAARDISLKSLQMKGTASAKVAASTVHPLLAKRKIGVNESGLYYIDLSELPFASYIGKWSNATAYAISSQVLLKNRGQQVPYFIANDNKGVYFYGEDIESIYTDKNIYWAERGRGTLMQTVAGKGPLPAVDGQTFIDTVHIEENTLPIIAVVTDPTADYWGWGKDFIYAGYPGIDLQTFAFPTYGAAPVNKSADLTVHLYGLTDTDHHAEIWLNNEYVGEGRWSGIHPESFTFSVNQSLLKDAADGENAITVKGLRDGGVPYSFITVDSFDLSYHREYKAVDNALFITGGTNTTVSVEGFSGPEIVVLDVSDATKPKRINAITVDTIGPDNHRVSFVPSTPQTRYLVTSLPGLKNPVASSIDTPSSLKSRSHNAAYLLITSNELKETAGNLSRYRLQKALTTEIVDIEDIMDEFNYGIFSPEAIRSFLAYAYKNWGRTLRYAVLIGEGTYDYKDFSGLGGNFMPPLMVSTPDGIVASDTALADIDGDHLPEIAIGRLPVVTPEELDAVINKIKTYETAADKSWRNRIVMMADHPEEGADFPLDSDSVAALLPQGYDVSRIYMSQQSVTSARTLLTNALQNGAGLINYVGHGGPDRLEQDGLLKNSDVAFMSNAKLPLLTAMTCAAGDFSQPGYDSLAELLLIKQGGGAIAVWSPSGYSNNEEAIAMDKEFFRSLVINTPGRTLLGDIVLTSLENAKKNGVSDYMLEIYNIIGDPALMLR